MWGREEFILGYHADDNNINPLKKELHTRWVNIFNK